MSKSNAFELALLALLFDNTAIANLGDAGGLRASAVAGSLYVALHSADPGEAGDQTTNEIAYTNYARVAVARSSAGFTVSGNAVQFFAQINFPAGGAGASPTATYWSVGIASSGASLLLYSGTITPNIICGNGITPQLAATTNIITED